MAFICVMAGGPLPRPGIRRGLRQALPPAELQRQQAQVLFQETLFQYGPRPGWATLILGRPAGARRLSDPLFPGRCSLSQQTSIDNKDAGASSPIGERWLCVGMSVLLHKMLC